MVIKASNHISHTEWDMTNEEQISHKHCFSCINSWQLCLLYDHRSNEIKSGRNFLNASQNYLRISALAIFI